MADTEEDYNDQRTLLQYIKDTLLAPIRLALSPPLLRTYLRTALILLASSILFAIAVIAYSSFYFAYVPVRGISAPVYLQFDATRSQATGTTHKFPYGLANVNGLVSRQKYDVVVEMVLPRSERNLAAGNWMLGLEMRGPGTVGGGGGVKGLLGWDEEWHIEDFSQGGGAGREGESAPGVETTLKRLEKPVVIARSRRPAILTYRSWMTESAYRALRLPLYMIGWGQESETVTVHMMEAVEFEKGWRNVPSSVRLEVRSKTPLEVYKVVVRFVARLEGLRWVMYRYRLTSFVVFTGLFWAVEMSVVMLTWGAFTLLVGGESGNATKDEEAERKKIKDEEEAATPKLEHPDSDPGTPLSDTSRTFPTLPSQQPLHYAPSPREIQVKDERSTPGLDDIPVKEEEADDEDEDADFLVEEPIPSSAAVGLTDSGIGTGLETSVEKGKGLSRRRSRGGGEGEGE